jgi:hypothetical protein
MTTPKAVVTISKLTYSELLATTPWIALLPNYVTAPPCEWHRGLKKPCKSPGRLLYVDLDGTMHHWCHHHLFMARMDFDYFDGNDESDLARELMRNYRWQRHVDLNRPGHTAADQ